MVHAEPDDRGVRSHPRTARPPRLNTRTANSPARTEAVITAAVIAPALIATVALAVPSFTVHFLSSPWLLVAVAVLAWIKFRPPHSHQ